MSQNSNFQMRCERIQCGDRSMKDLISPDSCGVTAAISDEYLKCRLRQKVVQYGIHQPRRSSPFARGSLTAASEGAFVRAKPCGRAALQVWPRFGADSGSHLRARELPTPQRTKAQQFRQL